MVVAGVTDGSQVARHAAALAATASEQYVVSGLRDGFFQSDADVRVRRLPCCSTASCDNSCRRLPGRP